MLLIIPGEGMDEDDVPPMVASLFNTMMSIMEQREMQGYADAEAEMDEQ